MPIAHTNPATGELVRRVDPMDEAAVAARIDAAAWAAGPWTERILAERCELLARVAALLR